MKNRIKVLSLFMLLAAAASVEVLISCKTQNEDVIKPLDYSASIRAEKTDYSVKIGDRLNIEFNLKNLGQKTWSASATNPCLLSYHLLDESSQIIRYDNRRFNLPQDISPGENIQHIISVKSPLEEGLYYLEFDLLREGQFWFSDFGSKTLKIRLTVLNREWIEDKMEWTLDYGPFTKFSSNVKELNSLYKLIRITLDQSAVKFTGRRGEIFGFSAGSAYPQIWVRDANTILYASKFFYAQPYLSSWIEEHLVFQRDSGSLEDWVDANGQSQKNTTETDQETSLIQAAYQIFELLGPTWLQKKIDGEDIISRLDRALVFVLLNRFDKKLGLVTGAHTADWGDVDMVDADDMAIKVGANTIWTADIYDQSMFYMAAVQMAKMFDALALEDRASFWRETAESIKKNTNIRLWQEDKGFYKVHMHLDALTHDFDEDGMFAMGGNAVASLAGLANARQQAEIIRAALERQNIYNISTISGTLLPPYPKNTFKHPLMDSPYEYQNGAQWDWFGGRLITSMFSSGFSLKAREKLIEIASKNIENKGFFEWDDQRGTGKGSDMFAGSAGSLGQALFEGYLGFKLTRDSLCLQPRLSKDTGRVHVYIPASDSFAAYEYRFIPENDSIEMTFNSNIDTKGQLRILSPWNSDSEQFLEKLSASLWVRLDGQSVPFSLSRLNHDIYIVINTDFKKHRLEIRRE